MPIGIQRLNARRSQPNAQIVFIKPLPGPDERIAKDFLERVAAQCLPVMRDNHVSVMTLEEFEPNREFVGRNFNAGECIQLVLKSPRSGRWLPFSYVQMVMMHELAHCKQMNHSRAFWAVRNQYAAEMHALWKRKYTGEGIWGNGAKLGTGEWEKYTIGEEEALPDQLCGGTYRSGRNKRRKKELSYQEKKQRRIEKKFGKNGVSLGADEETKVKLEKGKRIPAKPRVAGSARGRDLRAAAALARFEKPKEEQVDLKAGEETESGSESEDETENAVDVHGNKLRDERGRRFVKVCEDEDEHDPAAIQELRELDAVLRQTIKREPNERVDSETFEASGNDQAPESVPTLSSLAQTRRTQRTGEPSLYDIPLFPQKRQMQQTNSLSASVVVPIHPANEVQRSDREAAASARPGLAPTRATTVDGEESICSMCSYENPGLGTTCAMCANVLVPEAVPNTWKCQNESCNTSLYVNSGDCGVCGICGRRR